MTTMAANPRAFTWRSVSGRTPRSATPSAISKCSNTPTQALYDEAKKQGWTVISMKNDWKRIFAFEK